MKGRPVAPRGKPPPRPSRSWCPGGIDKGVRSMPLHLFRTNRTNPKTAETSRGTRRWTFAFLVSLCVVFFLGTVRADLVIFKDGFFVYGKIKQDKEQFVDSFSKQVFTAARPDGFFMVDDGARRIIF